MRNIIPRKLLTDSEIKKGMGVTLNLANSLPRNSLNN